VSVFITFEMRSYCIQTWLTALFLAISGSVAAQPGEAARYRTTVRPLAEGVVPPADTSYVDSLCHLARGYYGISADSAFLYARAALAYAGKTGYRKGEAESWRMIGNTHEMLGDYVNMLGAYRESLDIAEQLHNPALIAKVNDNIALFYKQQGEYEKAQQLMSKVRELYQLEGDGVQAALIADNQADIALREGKYDEALQFAEKAVQEARGADEPNVPTYNNDIGRILAAKGDYTGALAHYLQSLDFLQGRKQMLELTATKSLVSEVYCKLKNYPLALRYANEAFQEAQALRRKPELQGSARVLANIYEAKGDYRNALHYFKLYREYSDSLLNDEARKQLLTRAAQYDYEKQTMRLREAQTLKEAAYEAKLRKAALWVTLTAVVIAVLALVAFLLGRSRAMSRKMNQLLREKNEQIEEQKEILEQQAVQLLLSNQQKDKLFTIVAHDLRGPLLSLKGVLNFLKEKKFSEQEIASMMNELRSNVDHSSELVSNLLIWASSRMNGMVTEPVLLELHEVVEEVLALFANQAREKNVLLRMEMAPSLVGYADKDMLQVVVRNLVSNAIKFSNREGVVTVNGCRKAGEIVIAITDDGIGMDKEALEKIRRKESFSNFGTAKERGTGLGILLCHEFAEANKGRFFVESELGRGSRCYFTIPAAPSSSSMRL
jgi:two-component system sensor histidine kinase/response regulator